MIKFVVPILTFDKEQTVDFYSNFFRSIEPLN